MEEDNLRSQIESEAVEAFVDASERYCTLIEERNVISRVSFIEKAHETLSLLYYRSLLLPNIEPPDEFFEESISHDIWAELFRSLQDLLVDWEYYWDVFNPNDPQDEDPICSNLADDLADIYRDIKTGLLLWERDSLEAKQKAIWQWRFSFWAHTGQHINGALRAIYWRLYDFIDNDLDELDE